MSLEEYVENMGVRCPGCSSEDIGSIGELSTVEDGTVQQHMTCNSCGGSWTDYYTLTGYDCWYREYEPDFSVRPYGIYFFLVEPLTPKAKEFFGGYQSRLISKEAIENVVRDLEQQVFIVKREDERL